MLISAVSQLRDLNFIPRKKLQAQLDTELTKRHIAILSGLVGSGKTALALEYVYQQLDKPNSKYKFIGWIDENERAASFRNIALKLGINWINKQSDKESIEANIDSIKQQLEALTLYPEDNRTWLLVFDDIAIQDDVLRKLLTARGDIICTSRRTDWNYSIKVGCYNEEESATYLARALGYDNLLEQSSNPISLLTLTRDINQKEIHENLLHLNNSLKEDMKNLHNQLNGSPLALKAAVKFIEEKGITLHHLLQNYQFKFQIELYPELNQIESKESSKQLTDLFSVSP